MLANRTTMLQKTWTLPVSANLTLKPPVRARGGPYSRTLRAHGSHSHRPPATRASLTSALPRGSPPAPPQGAVCTDDADHATLGALQCLTGACGRAGNYWECCESGMRLRASIHRPVGCPPVGWWWWCRRYSDIRCCCSCCGGGRRTVGSDVEVRATRRDRILQSASRRRAAGRVVVPF